MGTSVIGFGLLSLIPNATVVAVLAFLLRILQGMSSSFIQTTCYSIISVLYPDKRDSYIPIIEFAIGLGNAIGPILGAVLYRSLGFEWTFITIGGSFYVLFPLFYIVLPKSIDKKDVIVTTQEHENSVSESFMIAIHDDAVTYAKIANKMEFILPSIGAFFSYFSISFQAPILALRVSDFHISRLVYGLFFG